MHFCKILLNYFNTNGLNCNSQFVTPFYDSSPSIYDPVSYFFSQPVYDLNLEKN